MQWYKTRRVHVTFHPPGVFFLPFQMVPECFQMVNLTLLCITSSLPLMQKKPDRFPLHNI